MAENNPKVTADLDIPYTQKAEEAKTFTIKISSDNQYQTIKIPLTDAVELVKSLMAGIKKYRDAQNAAMATVFDKAIEDISV